MSHEQLKNYEQQLEEIRVKQHRSSRQYYETRIQYAKEHAYFQKLIALKFIEYKGKKGYGNMGSEQAILMILGEWARDKDKESFERYENYLVLRGKYKALDRRSKHLRTNKCRYRV